MKPAHEGNSPKLETDILQRVNVKHTVVRSHNGILLGNKEERTMGAHNNLDESQGNDAE